jgi:hypothetical protein
MGNIHGNCINVDVLARNGSTYFAEGEDDFLNANDAWFMPVSQKTGPDGCLYVLDWYDRYHCYQDARRDPEGIDRLKGRLYRIRYGESPRAAAFDLSTESDQQLIQRLSSPNIFFRETATRLLSERAKPESRSQLQQLVLNAEQPHKTRMHALWALVGQGPLDESFHAQLLAAQATSLRAWGVRAAGNQRTVPSVMAEKIVQLAKDESPDVQLQVAIAAAKLEGVDPLPVFAQILGACGEDPLIPHIVWQNLHPLLGERGPQFLAEIKKYDLAQAPALKEILPRVTERLLSKP